MLIVCLVSNACAHAHAQLRMCINACLLSVDRFHRFTDLDFLQSPPSAICVFLCLDCVRCVCAIDCAWNDRTKYCNKKNCTTHGRSVVGLWHSVCNWMNEAKHINIAMRRQCYYYISSTGNWACDGQKAFDDRHFYQPTQCRGDSYFFFHCTLHSATMVIGLSPDSLSFSAAVRSEYGAARSTGAIRLIIFLAKTIEK